MTSWNRLTIYVPSQEKQVSMFFITDKKTINAVVRSLEIIGEATKKIPVDIRASYPHITLAGNSRDAGQTSP